MMTKIHTWVLSMNDELLAAKGQEKVCKHLSLQSLPGGMLPTQFWYTYKIVSAYIKTFATEKSQNIDYIYGSILV